MVRRYFRWFWSRRRLRWATLLLVGFAVFSVTAT